MSASTPIRARRARGTGLAATLILLLAIVAMTHAPGVNGPPGPAALPTRAVAPSAGVKTPIANDGLVLTMLRVPYTSGVLPFELQLTTDAGEPVTGATVELDLEMLDMDMGIQVVTMGDAGGGRYRAEVPIGMFGNWQARIIVTRDGQSPVSFFVPFVTQ